jgi:hypothetical protein
VNHNVHLCIKGCFTLKLSGSWNTVICSSSLGFVLDSLFPPSGEIGIVDRSTGEVGFAPLEGASRLVEAIT